MDTCPTESLGQPFITNLTFAAAKASLSLSIQSMPNPKTLERIERTISMLRTFQQVYTIDGALAANHVFTFKAPYDMQIVHVSLSNSSANAGTFDLGPSTDADGYKDGATFGVSAACTELD